ncbi:hypothetical protein CR152_31560 [Massilia violaceinigra]|uniref:Ig-like domain-containing protein n=1 Tax=Massilia violaceinigra TaxID=2045208 RepID=A0A2D2DU97_9BURK|nr:hypothetical protein [Massilia violaceinigra]ATQ78549.1 hypothetical protein CR152_31560 [Massilia violaceinigra]
MSDVKNRFFRSGALASGLICLAGITACGSDDDSTTPVKQPDPVVSPQPVTAASITTQPKTQAVQAGQPATFSAVATGSGTLSYQWWRNGVAIPGATSAIYTTLAATLADSGDVLSVVVRNDAGTSTSDAVALQVEGVGVRVLAGGAVEPTRAQVDGVGKMARFLNAGALANDGAGNLLLADTGLKSVRKITPAGVVSTAIVGGTPAPALRILRDVAAGANGIRYVIDGADGSPSTFVRKIGADGAVSTIELGSTQGDPAGTGIAPPVFTAIATDAGGNLYVASEVTRPGEPECSSCFKRAIVRKVAADGTLTTVFENLGPHSASATITDVAVDKNGKVYVLDDRGIRTLDAAGVPVTLVPNNLAFIKAIALDAGGNVYFATEPFSGIPSTWPAGAIGKIAADRSVAVVVDPNGSDARFKSADWIANPAGIAFDAAGALYVSGNGRVLKLVLP